MLNETEYLLTCCAEECAEIQHRIAKAQRFGLHEIEPGPGQFLTNAERIVGELLDLKAVLQMLFSRGTLRRPSQRDSDFMVELKRDKVLRYMEQSRRGGFLCKLTTLRG